MSMVADLPKKAVIYARVSSEEQKKEGFSIEAQLDLLRDYAKKNNFDVVKEFTEAETAKQSGRHKFTEMLKFLKKSKDVNVILVEKTDRLYRNFRDYVDVDDNKFEIHLVKENEIITPDKKEFSNELRTNLQAEANRIRHRIDKITDEYYDDKVDAKFYNEKRLKWTQDLDEIMIKLEALHHAEKKYYDEGVRIVETLKNAYTLYLQQPSSEKRKMLNYLLSNCVLKGRRVSYDYNLPFSYFVNFDVCRKKYACRDSNAGPSA